MAASLFRGSGKNSNPGLFHAETGLSDKILGWFTGGVKARKTDQEGGPFLPNERMRTGAACG
jgi:hypothetical protein